MELKDISVTVESQNVEELSALLQKAADQLEQLEKTIDEIHETRSEIKIQWLRDNSINLKDVVRNEIKTIIDEEFNLLD